MRASGTADVCAETDFAIPIAATPPSSAISERFRLSVLSGLNQEFMTAASIAVIIGNIDRRRARLRNELDRAEWAGVRAAPTGSQRYANRGCRCDPVVTITNRRGLDAYLGDRRPGRGRQIGCRGDREHVLADPSGIVRVNRRDARDDRAWWRRATFVTVRLRCGWRNRGQQRA